MGSLKSSQASLRLSPVHLVVPRLKKPQLSTVSWFFLEKARLVRSIRRLDRSHTVSVYEKNSRNFIMEEERPSFDLNLAVILAGFAFESYRNPPVCSLVFLSLSISEWIIFYSRRCLIFFFTVDLISWWIEWCRMARGWCYWLSNGIPLWVRILFSRCAWSRESLLIHHFSFLYN